jgi:uroporphyrinogen-III synthase
MTSSESQGEPAVPGVGRLAGLRLCSFESRRQADMQSLIQRQGGEVLAAPSMREIPLEQNAVALEFGDRLRSGSIDVMVFLTGVGARALAEVLALQMTLPQLVAALRECVVVVRGPKPAAVMREWGVRIDVQVPEPNTWRELLDAIARQRSIAGQVVAVQEYGIPNLDLYRGLEQLGAQVVPVPVYRWELPEDTRPLREAIRRIAAGECDVLLFTSAQQWRHVEQIAREEVGEEVFRAAARRCVIASIGPTASETLLAAGFPPDIEPPHPKMGHLVLAVAEHARRILAEKRAESNRDSIGESRT